MHPATSGIFSCQLQRLIASQPCSAAAITFSVTTCPTNKPLTGQDSPTFYRLVEPEIQQLTLHQQLQIREIHLLAADLILVAMNERHRIIQNIPCTSQVTQHSWSSQMISQKIILVVHFPKEKNKKGSKAHAHHTGLDRGRGWEKAHLGIFTSAVLIVVRWELSLKLCLWS